MKKAWQLKLKMERVQILVDNHHADYDRGYLDALHWAMGWTDKDDLSG